MKAFSFVLSILCAVIVAGCGSGLEGTYASDQNGFAVASYTFKSNGKVISKLLSMEQELDYERDGKEIKLSSPAAPGVSMVMTIIDENTISGPMGIRLNKVK
ncbi:hypothetical protein OU994_30360 [Pseudoduganella sp. SL102]|uniref:hypothetical protein n=1 Tax=Pseudoduganella sp. SL102 TaxID=2995154 RepID=UPI00248B0901|nr:hypothetical protein [Pseudoduganella sp. SL102]WBS02496.1 hypothetical protein OU994_30360 [Pseudoduganella sp. SL102]